MVVYTRIHLVIVSIHTPTQGVTFLYICNVFRICFNPHTHAGCDPKCRTFMKPIIKFQSTHPRRVWHWCFCFPLCGIFLFQSTHPRRVWRHLPQLIPVIRVFQSTHPRRVWHRQKFGKSGTGVSIHTPTQGVTKVYEILGRFKKVSIHTPTQGVTYIARTINFGKMFQSTHPRRVWLWIDERIDGLVSFQSTHPRRVWPCLVPINTTLDCFNPHTHAGCDCLDNILS